MGSPGRCCTISEELGKLDGYSDAEKAELYETIGLWPAIAVNIALYSGTHIPKGQQETVGAIPLCIALCLISVQTGNMWTAAIIHIAMSYTNTLTTFKRHPEMKYVEA